MPRTFEEKVGKELDSLYQAALFLCAGERRCAEELLIHTMTHSVRVYEADAGAEPFERWLEIRLIRQFLDGAAEGVARGEPTADLLFRAAEGLPAQPRAAVWLVQMRRWSYDDAASALGVERSELKELLLYRDLLAQKIIGPAQRGDGVAGVGS